MTKPSTKVITSQLSLNSCQKKAKELLAGTARYILLMGGGGSGKSTVIAWYMINIALNAHGSRQLVFRETSQSCRITMFDKTFKDTLKAGWPGLIDDPDQCKINETEMTIEFPALGSIILFGGLQENNLDRILGQEACTIFLNEATDLEFTHFEQCNNRLRQPVEARGRRVRNKLLMDCNPTDQSCWLYPMFVEGLNPSTRQPHRSPDKYAALKLLPHSNRQNLDEEIFEAAQDGSEEKLRRFWHGEWKVTADGALWKSEWLARPEFRLSADLRDDLRDSLARIIVAIDPAASSKEGSDETGIIVAGIDHDGTAYVLDDLSGRYTPTEWAKVATDAYRSWGADLIVAERNNGGEMVETTIRNVDPGIAYTSVWASRGKETRAAPAAHHYEMGRVKHVGVFRELEAQMVSFTTGFDRRRKGSPDRVDALVWALEELMVAEKPKPTVGRVMQTRGFWG